MQVGLPGNTRGCWYPGTSTHPHPLAFGGHVGKPGARARSVCVTDSWLGATSVPGVRAKQSAFGQVVQAQLERREGENEARRDLRGQQLLRHVAVGYVGWGG